MFGGGEKPEVCCVSSSRLSLDAPLLGLPAIGEGEREGGEVTGER